MAPRGLSAEEKRVKLLEIFHETKDFYQLKELEKLGPKMKGIVSQSVKEVLQSLVDDGLVQGDKIGSSNFFWSFPSQQGVAVQARLAAAIESRDTQKAQLNELKTTVAAEKLARPDDETRTQQLERLAVVTKELVAAKYELEAHGQSDPGRFAELQRGVILAKEAAMRWTDNYGLLLRHFTSASGVDGADIRQYLGIEDTYEEIE